MREKNILENKFDLNLLIPDYTLIHLINSMIQRDPNHRPSISQAMNHPYFWQLLRKIHFFKEFSDYFERQCKCLSFLIFR